VRIIASTIMITFVVTTATTTATRAPVAQLADDIVAFCDQICRAPEVEIGAYLASPRRGSAAGSCHLGGVM
jgi:hypothetical protein